MCTHKRCAQTPHGGNSHTCCLSGTMHSAYTVWRQLNAHPLAMLPSRDDVHRHRVLAARCTRRSEDRNRLVAFTNICCPPGAMCTDTVWRQPHAHPEAKIAIAWWHSQIKFCPPGTMCTDTVWWQPHAHSEAKIAIAWWHTQDHMLPNRDDVHRHRMMAAGRTRRGEDRNRMVPSPNG
jgi:hypothetical protein